MAHANVVRVHALTPLSDDLAAAIEGFLNYCRAKNLSPNTIIYYRNRLGSFSQYLAGLGVDVVPRDVTAQVIRGFLTHETTNHSASTANHSHIALQAFFGFLVRDGFLMDSPMSNVEKPRRRRAVISTFSLDEIQAILATCLKDFVGVRDQAMLLTMLDCGLRASELCGLRLDDVSWGEQTLLVVGKGDKERVVPFGSVVRQTLTEYLGRRGELACRALFVSVYGEPMDRFRLRMIVKRRCEAAAIEGARCSPHTFRHTCAVMFLRAGGDAFTLQKLLGHSDLSMTRRYCELSQTDVVEKHRLCSPADRVQPATPSMGRKRLR